MKDLPISVIIPCYNIEQHLPKCIDSILAQTCRDFELLLIDDGSADGTLDVCNAYKDKDSRIKVFTHPNKGVSFTRNRGIEVAVGEYLMFIDGDDYLKDDYIEKLVAAAEKGSWPICGMINVRNGNQVENGNYRELLQLYPESVVKKEDFIDLLKFSSLSSPCARIYDKAVILEHAVLFDEETTYQEDLIFNLKYIRYIQKAVVQNYYGYFYIEHPASSTGRYHKKFEHLGILTEELGNMVRNVQDELVVKEFIFQTVLRQIANIFHGDAPTQKEKRIQSLNYLLHSKPFIYAQDFIFRSKINVLLKLILKFKNPQLIYFYYKKLHL